MIEDFQAHRQLLFGIAYACWAGCRRRRTWCKEVCCVGKKQQAGTSSPESVAGVRHDAPSIDQLRSARRQREEYYGVWRGATDVPRRKHDPGNTPGLATR